MGVQESLIVVKRNIDKNSPTILTIIASFGVAGLAWSTYQATQKANALIMDELEKRQEELDEQRRKLEEIGRGDLIPKFTTRDVVELTWRCYIAPAGIGIATIACIIGANRIHLRRYAALASAYGVTSEAYKTYKSKVAETFGKNKELKVRDEVATDHAKANISPDSEIITTGKGETLFLDRWSGQIFKSEAEQIRRTINNMNREMNMAYSDGFISLNELYYDLGLRKIEHGDLLGWHFADGEITVSFTSTLIDDKPYTVLNFDVKPKYYH